MDEGEDEPAVPLRRSHGIQYIRRFYATKNSLEGQSVLTLNPTTFDVTNEWTYAHDLVEVTSKATHPEIAHLTRRRGGGGLGGGSIGVERVEGALADSAGQVHLSRALARGELGRVHEVMNRLIVLQLLLGQCLLALEFGGLRLPQHVRLHPSVRREPFARALGASLHPIRNLLLLLLLGMLRRLARLRKLLPLLFRRPAALLTAATSRQLPLKHLCALHVLRMLDELAALGAVHLLLKADRLLQLEDFQPHLLSHLQILDADTLNCRGGRRHLMMDVLHLAHVGRSTTRYSFEISSLNIERMPCSNLSATGLIVQCRRGPKVASTTTVELTPAMKAAAGGVSFGTQKLSFSATLFASKSGKASGFSDKRYKLALLAVKPTFGTAMTSFKELASCEINLSTFSASEQQPQPLTLLLDRNAHRRDPIVLQLMITVQRAAKTSAGDGDGHHTISPAISRGSPEEIYSDAPAPSAAPSAYSHGLEEDLEIISDALIAGSHTSMAAAASSNVSMSMSTSTAREVLELAVQIAQQAVKRDEASDLDEAIRLYLHSLQLINILLQMPEQREDRAVETAVLHKYCQRYRDRIAELRLFQKSLPKVLSPKVLYPKVFSPPPGGAVMIVERASGSNEEELEAATGAADGGGTTRAVHDRFDDVEGSFGRAAKRARAMRVIKALSCGAPVLTDKSGLWVDRPDDHARAAAATLLEHTHFEVLCCCTQQTEDDKRLFRWHYGAASETATATLVALRWPSGQRAFCCFVENKVYASSASALAWASPLLSRFSAHLYVINEKKKPQAVTMLMMQIYPSGAIIERFAERTSAGMQSLRRLLRSVSVPGKPSLPHLDDQQLMTLLIGAAEAKAGLVPLDDAAALRRQLLVHASMLKNPPTGSFGGEGQKNPAVSIGSGVALLNWEPLAMPVAAAATGAAPAASDATA
eukprot:jgi/Chrpa1/16987/Chrysochromulina_OHIO_Genome00019672-RA